MGRGERATRREGASLSRAQWRDRVRAWLHHHRLSAADSLLKVLERPGASLLTWLVIGIALALPVGFDIALDNIDRLGAGWQSPAQVSLFLGEDTPREHAVELAAELDARGEVATATFMAREEALAEFRTLSGFADVLDSLPDNPLPHVILVTPDRALDEGAVAALRDELADVTGVAEAVLDTQWLARMQGIMAVGRSLVLAVGAVLVLGVILVLGNTIRLAIENRREEIVVVKLVGGSNAFVRRPFLYTGLWYGVGGGLFAGLLVSAALAWLEAPVAALAALYDSAFTLAGPGVMGVLNLVVLGGLLGLAGAWLAVTRHLSGIEPR